MKKSAIYSLAALVVLTASAALLVSPAQADAWRERIAHLVVTGTFYMPEATTAAKGIVLGADAALYRSAADTLRTPDSFTSDVTITGADVAATDDITVGDDLAVTDAVTAVSVATTGLIKSSGTAGIGYAVGAGGTQTQGTSKATTVVLNKLCGTITMHGAQLNAGTIVSFTLTNSTIAATDVVVVQHDSGGTLGSYTVSANTMADGSCQISVRNNTAGNLTETPVLRFAVIKAVAS